MMDQICCVVNGQSRPSCSLLVQEWTSALLSAECCELIVKLNLSLCLDSVTSVSYPCDVTYYCYKIVNT